MLHDQHVLFPQVAEGAPARLALGKGVALHPPPAGVSVEVAAWVHGPIQASQDGTGHSDARLAQTQPRVPCRTEESFSSVQRQERVFWRLVWRIGMLERSGKVSFPRYSQYVSASRCIGDSPVMEFGYNVTFTLGLHNGSLSQYEYGKGNDANMILFTVPMPGLYSPSMYSTASGHAPVWYSSASLSWGQHCPCLAHLTVTGLKNQ